MADTRPDNKTIAEYKAMTDAERTAWHEARKAWRRKTMEACMASLPRVERLHANLKASRATPYDNLVADVPANVSRPVLFPELELAQQDIGECYRLLTLARVKNERLEADNASLTKSVRYCREQERKAWNRAFGYQMLAFAVCALWATFLALAYYHVIG